MHYRSNRADQQGRTTSEPTIDIDKLARAVQRRLDGRRPEKPRRQGAPIAGIVLFLLLIGVSVAAHTFRYWGKDAVRFLMPTPQSPAEPYRTVPRVDMEELLEGSLGLTDEDLERVEAGHWRGEIRGPDGRTTGVSIDFASGYIAPPMEEPPRGLGTPMAMILMVDSWNGHPLTLQLLGTWTTEPSPATFVSSGDHNGVLEPRGGKIEFVRAVGGESFATIDGDLQEITLDITNLGPLGSRSITAVYREGR